MEGSGLVADEAVATPPSADSKASVFLMIDICLHSRFVVSLTIDWMSFRLPLLTMMMMMMLISLVKRLRKRRRQPRNVLLL